MLFSSFHSCNLTDFFVRWETVVATRNVLPRIKPSLYFIIYFRFTFIFSTVPLLEQRPAFTLNSFTVVSQKCFKIYRNFLRTYRACYPKHFRRYWWNVKRVWRYLSRTYVSQRLPKYLNDQREETWTCVQRKKRNASSLGLVTFICSQFFSRWSFQTDCTTTRSPALSSNEWTIIEISSSPWNGLSSMVSLPFLSISATPFL